MKRDQIFNLVQEEISKMIKESKENSPKISGKLENLRKKLEPSMSTADSLGIEHAGGARKGKRVQIATVADLINIPVSELMLHFLNDVKGKNERSLIEYRLGHVHFYCD